MAEVQQHIAWIAVDWGTSNLRIWAMGADDQVLAEAASDAGMGTLERGAFEAALLDLVDPYLRDTQVMPVVCCGMVGSRQGWAEAPYLSVPCKVPTGAEATRVASTDARIDVHILPGIKQVKRPDVMRGEETQIAGFLKYNPGFDGILCMPGTHTKWVHISAEEVVSFQTCMTGEIFALLSGKSVLRHTVAGDGFDPVAFGEAVGDAMSRPQTLASDLFALRAGALVADLGQPAARARLSGLLIGAELAATRAYWLGQSVVILGDDKLARLYHDGLAAQGVAATIADVCEITLAGLCAAHAAIKETAQ